MLPKKGIKLLDDVEGEAEPVYRQHNYIVAIRVTLNHPRIKGKWFNILIDVLDYP